MLHSISSCAGGGGIELSSSSNSMERGYCGCPFDLIDDLPVSAKDYTKIGHEAPFPNDTAQPRWVCCTVCWVSRGSSYRDLRSIALSDSISN